MTPSRILGIDPGVERIGFGVIEKRKGGIHALRWGRITTSRHHTFADRLLEGARAIQQLIRSERPALVAIEQIFFAKNVKTAMAVAHMRGALIVAAAEKRIPVVEYTPLQVKQAVTGYGKAEKRQVQIMLRALCNVTIPAHEDDAADALAVAYTALVYNALYDSRN